MPRACGEKSPRERPLQWYRVNSFHGGGTTVIRTVGFIKRWGLRPIRAGASRWHLAYFMIDLPEADKNLECWN